MWIPQLAPGDNLAETIVHAIEADLETGKLRPGDRLPTQRELADAVGVALGTVTRAYNSAKSRGLVTGTIGRGTFVAGKQEDDEGSIDFGRNLLHREQRDGSVRTLLSALGDPAEMAELLDREQDPAGFAAHRAAGAVWLSRPGFHPAPDDVVICSGVQHGMHVILGTAARPGDLVVTEAVTYAGIKAIAALLHLQLRGLPLDSEGLEPQAFLDACKRGAKFLYTTPTLQNPTATTMSVVRRREIGRIAEEYGVTILEDDVYGFLHPNAPTPLAAYAPANTYYMVGTSKSIAPGLRVGYVVCPRGTAQRIANTVRTTIWETSPIMSAIVTKWINDGTAARIMTGKQSEVRTRNQVAMAVLEGVEHPPEFSPHWWIHLPAPWHADDLTKECRDRGLSITPASTFAIERENVPMAVRICIGAVPTRRQLEHGLELFRDIWKSGPKTFFSTT